MCIRIQLSHATVKALHSRLQHASRRDDIRLVRRTPVLIDLLVHHVPIEVLGTRWGRSISGISQWRQAFLLQGMDSLTSHHGGGRRPKLTPRQKKRLVELREAGPLVVGCETAWWTSVLSRVLIWREFGVLYNCQDVCPLRHTVGVAFHKARGVSEHRDAARRQHGLPQEGPTILRAAERRNGLMLFEDEASFAQRGSLSSTWSRRGQQPEGKTSGTRKGDKVFGAMEYFSGRLFSQGIAGRFTSDSDQECLPMILAHPTAHLFLIHAGARYHPSQATQPFLATHHERIAAYPLPSYAPDYNPIAYLWKKTKKRAPHNQYFKECAALTVSVDKALAYVARHPAMVLELFGLYCEESGLALKQAA